MPSLNGIEAARRLKQSNPDSKLITLTMHGDLTPWRGTRDTTFISRRPAEAG